LAATRAAAATIGLARAGRAIEARAAVRTAVAKTREAIVIFFFLLKYKKEKVKKNQGKHKLALFL
jgi:hypothetical protein